MLKFNWKLQTFLFYALPLCDSVCPLRAFFRHSHPSPSPPPLQSRASLIGWGNRSRAAAASGKVKRSRSSFKGVLFQSDWIVLAAHTQLTPESGKKQLSLDQLMLLFEVGVCELLPEWVSEVLELFKWKKLHQFPIFADEWIRVCQN